MISIIKKPLNKLTELIYKSSYKLLQFPTRSIIKAGKQDLIIQYKNLVIKDIEFTEDDCLYHGRCIDNCIYYSLQGATLDLLVQDLIYAIEDVQSINNNDH